jgi:hypothetical protein
MTDNPYQPPQTKSHLGEPLRGSKLAWIPVFLLALLLVFTLVSGSEFRKTYREFEFSLPLISQFALGWWFVAMETGLLLLAVMAACMVRKRGLLIASQVGLLLALVVMAVVYLLGALLPFVLIIRDLS